jgi:hypothetical protein
MRVEKVRADSRQAATRGRFENGRSIECEFDHLFLVKPPLSQRWRACRSSMRLSAVGAWVSSLAQVAACAQKKSEPTHVRLLREAEFEIGRSIECEFDHLFLVKPPLNQRWRVCRSSMRPSAVGAWASSLAQVAACAQKKSEPTHVRLLRRAEFRKIRARRTFHSQRTDRHGRISP